MNLRLHVVTCLLTFAASAGLFAPTTIGQVPVEQNDPTAEKDMAARQQILASDRWRRVGHAFNEWLATQQVYRGEEVARMKSEMRTRIDAMSAAELEEFLDSMEERLRVLLSPEAEESRIWLEQFLAVARNPEKQLGRELPDVMNMSASQIRQELREFQQWRDARQQAQAAFNIGRTQRIQATQDVHAARREAEISAQESRARAAANVQHRSQYAPVGPNFTDLQPAPFLRPYYRVSPWGAPIRWNPLRDDYLWW